MTYNPDLSNYLMFVIGILSLYGLICAIVDSKEKR
jgi:hypothetical protein